jgi:hypothetical protein
MKIDPNEPSCCPFRDENGTTNKEELTSIMDVEELPKFSILAAPKPSTSRGY